MVEEYYPSLQKVDIFARTQRPGWKPWGNEAPDDVGG